jgi:hypothetical protein
MLAKPAAWGMVAGMIIFYVVVRKSKYQPRQGDLGVARRGW